MHSASFPGGFVDRGEAVAAAAVRETLEESKLRVTLTGILDVYSFPSSEVVVVVYAAEVVGGTLVKVLSWYDNEWGFSNRMLDMTLAMMAAK